VRAIVCVGGLALSAWVALLILRNPGPESAAGYTPDDLARIGAETRVLDEQVRQARLFAGELWATEAAVLRGELPLAEAGRRLALAARENNPHLLHSLVALDPDCGDGERMARLLLRRFDAQQECHCLSPERCELIACLRAEYEGGAAE
jgi:hypothetical protein